MPQTPFLPSRHVFSGKFAWILVMSLSSPFFSPDAQSREIPIEKLPVPSAVTNSVSIHPVLAGQVPDVVTDYVTIAGPTKYAETSDANREVIWMFIGGKGIFSTKGQKFSVQDEAIAFAPVGWATEIEVPVGETLLAIRIRKHLSEEDRAELVKYAQVNAAPYFKRFIDCPPYTEAIKSPKTVSRTLLPENIVPRMSVGTVYTTGPDQVGRHKHPMLEQLFIGLQNNNATVSADDITAAFPPLSILHIPLGSMHGTQVTAGNTLYYVWIDFFVTKEGQEWLKMHKPIEEKPPLTASK